MIEMLTKHARLFKWKREMTITMNSDLMPALVNLPYKIQVAFQTLSDQEKSCLNFKLRQNFKNSWRVARMRTVIEGQGDLAA